MLAACLVGLALFSAIFIARSGFDVGGRLHFSLFDDAMISMRYARNLAEGHGLAWNEGGAPVEGYTNLLWTLWMAVLHLLPVPEATISLLVMLTSAGLLLVHLVVVRGIVARVAPGNRVAAGVAVVLTATCYPLAYWSLRGMEVGLLAVLVSLGLLLVLRLRDRPDRRDLVLLCVVVSAMLAVRTDALVPAAVIGTFAFLVVGRRTGLAVVGSALVTLAAVTAFRLAYYGVPLPNTYYLKVTGVPTGVRLDTGLVALRQVLVVQLAGYLVLGGLALAALGRRRDPALLLLGGLVVAQLGYSASVGGDAWELFSYANRYVCVALPALFVLCGVGVAELAGSKGPRRATLLGGVLAGSGSAALLLRAYGAREGGYPAPNVASVVGLDRWSGTLLAGGLVLLVGGIALVAARARLPARLLLPGGAVAVALCGVAALAANGAAVAGWVRHGGESASLDAELAEAGVAERAAIADGAAIAVWFAGNSAYFSHRESIDLLGKSDATIARLPSEITPFIPGHGKRDFAYSIRQLRPDVVDLGPIPIGFTPGDLVRYRTWGYEAVSPTVLVRADSRLVDRSVLARLYDEGDLLER